MLVLMLTAFSTSAEETKKATEDQYLRLPVAEYVDRMTAGWIGQMAGVGVGAPTEFLYNGRIVPAEAIPAWNPVHINQFWQDDLYVEMTFLKSLEDFGWDISHRQAGIGFAQSGYPLWHANATGRRNLRQGIAPPDSGHPQFNDHADDIDYQIEADYSGLIAPGMPHVPIKLGETFGRLVNYGDGIYGGQFVGGMYAAAFFETDPEKIVRAGLKCIPSESQYAECVRDAIDWWKIHPDDWQATWRRIEAKYNENPQYRKGSCGGGRKGFNIDAKINGAYIVVGLLYGQRDPDQTIVIATRCGQDSDCNPSSAGGILFTSLGLAAVPEKYTARLKRDVKFAHTDYTFAKLVEVCEKLARDAVMRAGGKLIQDQNGQETFLIPRRDPQPSPLEQSWQPGPIAGSRYSEAEMEKYFRSQRLSDGRPDMNKALEKFAPGWNIRGCGLEMDPGIRDEYRGRKNVLLTHPDDSATPCVLFREITLPEKSTEKLRFAVSHYDGGDWRLVVKINEKTVKTQVISEETVTAEWLPVEIDLSRYAGQTIKLELINKPTGWYCEAAYWDAIRLNGN